MQPLYPAGLQGHITERLVQPPPGGARFRVEPHPGAVAVKPNRYRASVHQGWVVLRPVNDFPVAVAFAFTQGVSLAIVQRKLAVSRTLGSSSITPLSG